MQINIDKQIEYWLTTAKSDLETAESLLALGKNLHHCLFFLHLVIEKHLKALVVKHTKEIAPKTHDLGYLSRKAELTLTTEQQEFLDRMNQFVLEARYPEDKLEIYKMATPELAHTTKRNQWSSFNGFTTSSGNRNSQALYCRFERTWYSG
ncbi:MAG: HEPN domain-containing protein [Ignavibacteriae bacterium]|nr:HEPN domain-containing protein [Ignavibacteriota bacterium]